MEWAAARAEIAGTIDTVSVQRGQDVAAGAPLVSIDSTEARSELAAALARIQQAKAEQRINTQGGRASDLAEIENNLASARVTLQEAQRNLESLQRLVEKQAATKQQLREAQDQVARAKIQIRTQEQRRATLVTPGDRTVGQAKLNEAQAAEALANHRLASSVVKAPMSGTVYEFDLKRGAYLQPGELVANVGRLDKVRVKIYVDEPDLGRVAKGQPVTITWDAKEGKEWKGSVEQVPTQIVALGTRQVGEVTCLIDNPGRELLPGTNIYAKVITAIVHNVVGIPREALRSEERGFGVYKLNGSKVHWQPVKIGVSNLTRVQIQSGLAEGEAVALPAESAIKDGDTVKPVIQ